MSTGSIFGFVFIACAGGGILLLGLLMERFSERDRHKEWYKNIADLRRWEFIKWLGEWFVIVGVIIETLVAGFLARDEWRAAHDALNRPITSISAIATFRIKGDLSPPPLPYPDLQELTGASISFIQTTNVSDALPNISLAADAPDINIFNLIPNNEHPDTHDVVIKFKDAGDVMVGHFENKWMWQNRAGFFDNVKGFVISMRQIGSNVNVLSGNVVVTANDHKWEFPIPAQKQRLGVISCKLAKNTKNQVEPQVLPFPICDITGRKLGYFDGK